MRSDGCKSGHIASRRMNGTDEEASWQAIISQVTWMVCRKFQFQVFNYIDSRGKGALKADGAAKCSPATAFLVADHLSQLLITDGMSREDCAVSPVGFGNAVWRLHVTIFTPYEAWAAHENFEAFHRLLQSRATYTEDPSGILTGLLDLCTYFCLWTEASTLRHMPESLWFFFCIKSLYVFHCVEQLLVMYAEEVQSTTLTDKISTQFSEILDGKLSYMGIMRSLHPGNCACSHLVALLQWLHHLSGCQCHLGFMYMKLLYVEHSMRTMQQSYNFTQLYDTLVGEHGVLVWRSAFDGTRVLTTFSQRRLEMRRTFNDVIHAQRKDAKVFLPANVDRQQYPRADFDNLVLGSPDFRSELIDWGAINSSNTTGSLSTTEQALLWDLVLFGDGGAFVDRIITPVFRALAHEVSTKGGQGVEPAMRITYDDANECFVLPQNVRRIIADLGGDTGVPGKGDLFYKLWVLGDGNDGFDADRATLWYTSGHGDATLRPNEEPLPWLVKTFQERRTWFATYLAYYRIFVFHILWFHVLLALAFAQDPDDSGDSFQNRWWIGISSVVITHAFFEVLYCYAMLYTRSHVPAPPAGQMDVRKQVIKNETRTGALASVLCCCAPRYITRKFGLEYERRLTDKESQEGVNDKLWTVEHIDRVSRGVYGLARTRVALSMWTFVFLILWFLFSAQFTWFPWPEDKAEVDPDRFLLNGKTPVEFFRDVWQITAWVYVVIAVLVWGPLTQRDGYIITPGSLYEAFTQLYSRNVGTSKNGVKKWYSFLRGEYMASVPPRVGWPQFFRNVGFWTLVIALKFCVDYLLILRQLPDPIRGLLRQNWLGTCGNDLMIGSSNVPCIENLVLVGALCLPIFLVVQFDTGILYQVVVFAYGCMNGLVLLGLGQVVTWNDLVKQFERGVEQFNKRLLSWQATESWTRPSKVQEYYQMAFQGTGSSNTDDNLPALELLNAEQTQEYQKWTPFADVWDSIILDLRLSDLISNEEEANLRFHAVHFLRKHDLKPHVLPVCFFAGKIQHALDEGSVDTLGINILKEAFLLFLALLTEIGVVSTHSQEILRTLALVNQPQNYYHNSVRKRMVNGVKAVVDTLSKLSKGANMEKLSAQLVAQVTALCEDTLIELQYCQLLLPNQGSSVSQHISTIHNILEGEPNVPGRSVYQEGAQQQRSSLLRVHDGVRHKLVVAENSLLDRTMAALCAQNDSNHLTLETMGTIGDQELDTRVPVREIRTLLKVLQQAMSLTDQQSEPKNEEAGRVLKFFMSTLLNGSMRAPQPVHQMRSLTTLVPHYAEGVIYPLDSEEVADRTGRDVKKGSLGDELVEQMSGLDVSTIDFLRIQFRDEWDNFVQRMIGRYGVKDVAASRITERDFRISERGLFSELPEARMDLMMWASERGQMLSRTVKGMMMYGSALRQLELLEAPDASLLQHTSAADGKFRHIVSSQVYGSKKASNKPADKWLALSVDHLMQKYPALRVAYIDTAPSLAARGKGTPMSVLLRWNVEEELVEECYRVRLPDQVEDGRGVILGEGKPENQNHAMIFCFSESIQTVDMNQENHLAEAFKMRNLLQEFSPKHNQYATGRQQVGSYRDACQMLANKDPIVALVGFREWIFSGKAGTLGQFAAGAEFAFGTIVQRTMAEPGGARFHYGHPDVWNKLFTMTRGGVSKATRAFHISEDVFGGYNAIFRGAVIKYKEYISVGKARDVGFAQINGFEAKVSGGNGEQSISRDVHRLGSKLDWFRLMSWYHSGIGFFINSTLTMASVYLAVWLVFFFALTDSLTVRAGSPQRANALVDEANLITTVNTVQLFQLGLLSVIPYWGELCLETGFLEGTVAILRQALAGSFLFFIFRQQTSAHYFTQIVYYGGAKYIATGRGFDLTHTPYVKHYESFGRSHIYFGFQLTLMAVMLAFLGIPDYVMATWGTWLVAISLTVAPFWFNPATFRVSSVMEDFTAWRKWLSGSADPGTGNSWTVFHRSQLEKARNVEGKQTDHGWNRAAGIFMQVFNVVILLALIERILRPDQITFMDPDTGLLSIRDSDSSLRDKIIGFAVFEFVLVSIIVMLTVARLVKAQGANVRRYISLFTGISLFLLIIFYVLRVGGSVSAGFVDIVLLAFANMTLVVIFVQVCLYAAPYQRWSITIVDAGYYAADTAIGLAIFSILFLASIVPLVDSLQALLLFSTELLVESRKGAQLRLFDAKRGELRNAVQTIHPSPPASKGDALSSHPTFVPIQDPEVSDRHGTVLASPPAGAAIRPSLGATTRAAHNAHYGTLGAQITLTGADSGPLGGGLRARNSGGRSSGNRRHHTESQ